MVLHQFSSRRCGGTLYVYNVFLEEIVEERQRKMWAGQGGRVEDMILAKLFGGGILLRVPRRGCMD